MVYNCHPIRGQHYVMFSNCHPIRDDNSDVMVSSCHSIRGDNSDVMVSNCHPIRDDNSDVMVSNYHSIRDDNSDVMVSNCHSIRDDNSDVMVSNCHPIKKHEVKIKHCNAIGDGDVIISNYLLPGYDESRNNHCTLHYKHQYQFSLLILSIRIYIQYWCIYSVNTLILYLSCNTICNK
jgi:hypothetical protein